MEKKRLQNYLSKMNQQFQKKYFWRYNTIPNKIYIVKYDINISILLLIEDEGNTKNNF